MPIARRIWAQKTAPSERADVQRDKIGDEGGEPDDNRRPLAPLKRSPDEHAHDDDFQSGA